MLGHQTVARISSWYKRLGLKVKMTSSFCWVIVIEAKVGIVQFDTYRTDRRLTCFVEE